MSSHRATVSEILTFSCVDGPGNRLVIFLQGCNYRCLSCHNPHTIAQCDHCGECVSQCPQGALSLAGQAATEGTTHCQAAALRGSGQRVHWDAALCSGCDTCINICPIQSSPKTRDYSVAELMELIRGKRLFLTGITVTGGEATLKLKFVRALFASIKNDAQLSNLSCMLDTNGSLSQSGWRSLLPVLDGAMIDLKAWQTDTHSWLVGRDNHRVIEAIASLAEHNKLYEVRLLLIPGKTDLAQEVAAVASMLTRLPNAPRIKINAFRRHGVRGEAALWDECSREDVDSFADGLSKHGVQNILLPSTL